MAIAVTLLCIHRYPSPPPPPPPRWATCCKLTSAHGAYGGLTQEFLSKFSQVAPSTLAPPSFPTDFMPEGPKAEEGAASTAIPDKLTFSFYLPHATLNSKQQVLCVRH